MNHNKFCLVIAIVSALLSAACAKDSNSKIDQVPFALEEVKSISVGGGHSCAIRGEVGEVWCWGYGEDGQIGLNYESRPFAQPVALEGGSNLTDVTELSLGSEHSCARLKNGRVACWGDNGNGQLGVPGVTRTFEARFVVGLPGEGGLLENIRSVSSGYYHTCVIQNPNRRLVCWGMNKHHQIGSTNAGTSVSQPQIVRAFASPNAEIQGAIQVTAGDSHTCVLFNSAWVGCIGENVRGQRGEGTLGRPDSSNMEFVRRFGAEGLVKLEKVESISAGRDHNCAVVRLYNDRPEVYCWGSNETRQLASTLSPEGFVFHAVPARDESLDSILSYSVDGGDAHTCSVNRDGTNNGTVQCWGENGLGALGIQDAIKNTPSFVVGFGGEDTLREIKSISAGNEHSCSVTESGRVVCWGYSQYGQTGYQSVIDRVVVRHHFTPSVVLIKKIEGPASIPGAGELIKSL